MRRPALAATLSLLLLLGAGAAHAVPIDVVLIGIWSENPGSAQPGSGTELQKGGKFVIKTTYDLSTATLETINGLNVYSVELASGSAPPTGGGLTENANDFEVIVPMEGFDSGTPFTYTQTDQNHLNFPGDPYPTPVPKVYFTDAGGGPGDFLGFRLEGDYAAGSGLNFIQFSTEVANIDPGDGTPVPTASSVVNIRDGNQSFGIVIRSVDGIVDSKPVVAEAGANMSYDAGNLTVTTDGGTFRNADGTWQDNDLGAGRSDGEDFLTHTWSNLGSVEGGATNVPLVGANATADRPNVIPSESPFVLQPPPSGTRTVDDVNKAVAIADSGLQSTTDTATWQIAVSEDLTGFDGGTDTMTVSYNNTGPVAEAGGPVVFDASNLSVSTSGATASDADLIVNTVIAGFETIESAFDVGGSLVGPAPVVEAPTTTTVNKDFTLAFLDAGLTTTLDTATLTHTVTDNAGAVSSDTATISYANALPIILDASASTQAGGVLFNLGVDDVDLAINLSVLDFEELDIGLYDGGALFTDFGANLIGTGSEFVDDATLFALFGAGNASLEVRVADRYLQSISSFVSAVISFDVTDPGTAQPIPEPSAAVLFVTGLAIVHGSVRKRRR
jgi:hypothetical protein